MRSFISLKGQWQFFADEAQQYTGYPPGPNAFTDIIHLPGTTAQAGKGRLNASREEGCLTEKYPFYGNAWFRRLVRMPEKDRGCRMQLFLERTRLTQLWVNGEYVGSHDSLCTPHIYDLTRFSLAPELEIIICVCNVGYPTKGGHMTSPDSQTNWNGITGDISLQFFDANHIISVRTIPDVAKHRVTLRMRTSGAINMLRLEGEWLSSQGKVGDIMPQMIPVATLETGESLVTLKFGSEVPKWDEFHPIIGQLRLRPYGSEDVTDTIFGLTDFHAEGMRFVNHGNPVFLRGKHDAMVFPREGAAPTDVNSWMRILHIAKTYGINHYRFHTCCPPDAAFAAADLLGIYMEPEIPFWGSLSAPGDEGFSPREEAYLIKEGRRILETFGNHPSFCMFSLGNELWGRRERLGEILRYYKSFEHRILMTQGSNNFQFWPNILPEDDFFVGVRFSLDRRIRGSYAACDQPYGFIQAERPSTMHTYDPVICSAATDETDEDEIHETTVQYATGVKTVTADAADSDLIPDRPVISHEIGQYASYPDLEEIPKYNGVLEAHNLKLFRDRLKKAGLLSKSKDFFACSGKLAVECYKAEIEAALRTESLSGFQMLDLQDFPGQGTATVGILNAFMEDKGFISPDEWRETCSDSVILGMFPDHCITGKIKMHIKLRHMTPRPVQENLHIIVMCGQQVAHKELLKVNVTEVGLFDLGDFEVELPETDSVHKIEVTLALSYTKKTYRLWQYPVMDAPELKSTENLTVTMEYKAAKTALREGRAVLYIPQEMREKVKGFYASDFWCYSMFRGITERMGMEEPPGTLGLIIDKFHPSLMGFRSERWTTPPWFDLLTHSDLAILDRLPIDPIVQMIDNVERNHKLAMVFECNVGKGRLLVCTSRLGEILDRPEVRWFAKCLLEYAESPEFQPSEKISEQAFDDLFR